MKNTSVIPIAFADDHSTLRKSLAKYLEDLGGISVVIETGNGSDLLRQLEQAKTLPELCMIDINMPGMDGFVLTGEIKKRWPDMPVLVLTVSENDLYIIRMIKLGAGGYLLKSCRPEEVKQAILSIKETGYYYSETAGQRLFRLVQANQVKIYDFNAMELALIKYSCTELSYAEIARNMKTSAKSIEGCRHRLFQKLGISSRVSLALFAIQSGIAPLNV